MAIALSIDHVDNCLHCRFNGVFNDISDVDEECGEKLAAACGEHQCTRLMLDYSGVEIAGEFSVLDACCRGRSSTAATTPSHSLLWNLPMPNVSQVITSPP